MSRTCNFDGCTVDDLGTCALERDPRECEHRIRPTVPVIEQPSITEATPAPELGAPVLERREGSASFPSSRPFGPDTLDAMMGRRYVSVIGILGDPESGKTACLASLYLLVSNARLQGWSFADSRTLMGFEDISRGARDWNDGIQPDQMTVHTEMADDYRPGFLHLGLRRDADGRRVDLALPDLPGEWTQDLVNTARTDRFEFLKSAEAIWMFADGRALADREKRNVAISDLGQLVRRLKTFLGGHDVRLMVVVTHHDRHPLDEQVTTRISKELARHGATADIVEVAPFSDNPESVKPGFGLSGLIDASVAFRRSVPDFWPVTEPTEGARSYLRHRRDR